MFRLIKLAAYCLFGYALYEFFRGMSSEEGQGSYGGGRSQGAFGGGAGRQQFSGGQGGGGGGGASVSTQDADGGSSRHMVGRGVIS